ncbi:flagellar assembly protein FliH [Desulfacinum hydrothermale DSM 13146]|uniref:Flagellar assembly protein FliH n=1 Tax=Desulfacinum hydrothermale DSM 13146 TaxID=1121390 RepID=A0A1W1X5N0_9BACT|nr:FliH/SctL family protein [Desulfacinum hydrothermale]SMC19226.1 flagellar assembly protein FliH [Desulfacinum hydrothermale DSM 13146]
MPWSKVIKGGEPQALGRFTFREIGEEGHAAEETHEPQGHEASPPEVDPLEELEETVRRQLLEAERRAQEIERDAYQKGYEQGQKDGFEFGAKSLRVVQEQMEALLQNMEILPSQIQQDYRQWLIRTSLSLAKIIVGREVRMDPSLLADLVDECLESMDRSHEITLILHPKDKKLLETHGVLAGWQAGQQEAGGVLQIRTDPDMERGGCRLISAIQEIDATLETRWRDLEARLAHSSETESSHGS